MGEVFLAQDVRLDRMVAIKMLPAKSIGDEQARKRLFREAKAAATLDHPNICAIHEVGEEADCAFIVMQYIEGATLSRMIKERVFSPLEVIDIAIQASEALAEAHSQGIIHRDIKPQNVILTPRGRVKILDFGLAKIVHVEPAMHITETESRLTNSGEVVGTVGYMSPEQLKDVPIDSRSDLFSLGVMLYECATGTSAFVGTSKIEICLQVIQVDPRRPSQVNPEIPLELDDIIVKAIAKDADARYQSAGEMLVDLRRLQQTLKGSRLDTRPLTPAPGSLRGFVTRGLSGSIRRPRVFIAAGLLLVPLVILGIWSALHLWRPSPHQPSPDAKSYYDNGTEAIRVGAYYQASKALEKSIEFDSRFALAHARLAETYVEIDYTDKAREELLRAMSLVPDRSALSSLDAMYLDAVAATVRRDFQAAIDSYGKIADQAADSEKSIAYVDLGRSYEKNEKIDKAIDYYEKAAKADQQSAAAFLLLGMGYGRLQDLPHADEAFQKAKSIYQAMSNQEGLGEVLYQRGALLSSIRKLADARKELEEALEISRSAINKYQFVKTQLQLSRVYYAEGNTERAKEIANEAIDLAQAKNIRNLATNGMIDLGYTLLARGEFNEAGNYFKQALNFAQEEKARRTEASAKMGLGRVILQQGDPDQAISLLQQALDFYQDAGYRKETSRAMVLLGRAHRNKGEYEAALSIFDQQLKLAKDLDDPAQMVASLVGIAITLGFEQEKYAEALPLVEQSYKINESIGARIGMGYDQLNRGILLWQLGRYKEAGDALDLAFSIANQPEASFKALLAWVNLANSQMALSQRRFIDAKAKGQQALDQAGTQDPVVAVQAKYCIGLAQAFSGATQPARKLCEEAVASAKEPRALSSARLALAEVLLLGNDAQGALGAALQAQVMFARAGEQDSEWRAWLIAARASQLAGDNPAMKDYASKADSLCRALRQKWGVEAYDGYLRRPDIQNYRKQLALILTRSK
jgi:serine/threonine protein kinase/lipopolysaccharide biosynthesis regulator YciM